MSIVNSHHYRIQVFCAGKKVSSLYLKFVVIVGKVTRPVANIGCLQLIDNLARRKPVTGQLARIQNHSDGARLAADDAGLRYVITLLDGVLQLPRYQAKSVGIVFRAPERQRQDGNIVDGLDFDNGLRDAGWNLVKIRI